MSDRAACAITSTVRNRVPSTVPRVPVLSAGAAVVRNANSAGAIAVTSPTTTVSAMMRAMARPSSMPAAGVAVSPPMVGASRR